MRVARLAICLFALIPNAVSAAIPAAERDALVALYESTGGTAWTEKAGWLGAPGTECTWAGVGCDDVGAKVVGLSLPGNGLAGNLPSKFSSLANLTYVDFSDNALTGSIGPELTSLARLESLHLGRNRLSGAIPPSIGSMSALRVLAVDSNDLEGAVPSEIAQLTELEELYIYTNRISSLPASIASLVGLVALDAANNRIAGEIPSALGSLPALESLLLQGNLLTGSIPPELGSLTALKYLALSYNGLTGPIPKELGALSRLEMLEFAANGLSGAIPPELGNLAQLVSLSLYDNDLEGAIPVDLYRLSALQEIYLGANLLSGPIPPGITGLSSLRYLGLGYNRLSGPIPVEIGAMAALESLELNDNQFTGTIAVELTRLATLRYLSLGGNQLTGEIPRALADLTRLEDLYLYSNQLTGTIPRELGQLRDLRNLQLGGNALEGTIPSELAALTGLTELQLGGNRLSGTIPEWIGDLSSLRVLILGGNQFAGPLPSSFMRLTALTYLDVGANRLTGPIPPDIGALQALEYLTLEGNFFDGQIPAGFWTLTNLKDARLAGLDLSGSLPPAIGNMASLEVLLLGDMDLSGPIPPEIGNLSNLLLLAMNLNRFTGTIPPEIGALTKLQYLDLSLNALAGPIPAEIVNLTSLEALDFDYNALVTTDPAIAAFVDSKQYDGNFRDSQTVTPANLRVVSTTDRSLIAEWSTIAFTEGEGGYRVMVSTSPGGSPAAIVMTGSKEATSARVRGLSPSTLYYVTIAAVTTPDGWRKNVVVSAESAAVTGATGPAVSAPADVDITATAQGLIQIDGTAANEDSFTLTNFGDATTSLVVGKNGDFFTIEPTSFALAGGASQTVRVRSVPQPAGGYWGDVYAIGDGVPEDLYGIVTLLSVARPAGSVVAEAVTGRIEITGLPGTDSLGSARFRNRGTASLAGLVVSDVPWLVPAPEPILIPPGETRSVNFTVARSRRPEGAGESALTGTLTLVYVDGSSENFKQAMNGTTPVSRTLVTVVDVPKPKVSTSPIPALGTGEIASFVTGVASVPGVSRSLVSDVGIANAYGTRAVDDLKVYYSRFGSSSVTVAAIAAIASESAVTLANLIPNVYGATSAESGTLQLRSSALDSLVVHSRVLNLAATGGSLLGEIPVLRSDRSSRPAETIVLTGLSKSATSRTDLYIQETSGDASAARIEILDASGAILGPAREVALEAFGTVTIGDVAPDGAVTALVTHISTGGRLAAHARVSDSTSGDLWSVLDWSRSQQRVFRSAALRIPNVASSRAESSSRKRLVRRDSLAGPTTGPTADATLGSFATELWLYNPGATEALIELALTDSAGGRRSLEIALAPRTTKRYDDAVSSIAGGSSSGALTITPRKGEVAATARLRIADPGCGSCGAALPVLPAGQGLRAGQTQRFSGLEAASAATVAARKPGTFRTGFGVVETSGASVKVRASLKLANGRSPVATLLYRDVSVAPGSTVAFDDLAAALYGAARGEADLHDLQVDFQVVDGAGSAVVYVTSTDNATGDTIVRTE